MEDAKDILAIPEHIIPVGLIAVAHKAVETSSWNRYEVKKYIGIIGKKNTFLLESILNF